MRVLAGGQSACASERALAREQGIAMRQLFFLSILLMMLAPALALLAAGRLAVGPWLAGRLGARKPALGLFAWVLLAAAGIAGALWYRAVEFPDPGPPFDLRAFETRLSEAAEQEAGELIRQACRDLRDYRQRVTATLATRAAPPAPQKPANAPIRK